MSRSRSQVEESRRSSFIHDDKTDSLPVRILKKLDIFSFIPVPKDDPVSTRKSLVGTAIFFTLFLTFVIYDFVAFLIRNPPLKENYMTPLDSTMYQLPRVAVAFVEGQGLNQSYPHASEFKFILSQDSKKQGQQTISDPRSFSIVTQQSPPEAIDWIDQSTKQIYTYLRTPSQPTYAKGLPYSSSDNVLTKIQIRMCDVDDASANCSLYSNITSLTAKGRIFLFIQNQRDNSSISQEGQTSSYMIYNFFLIPKLYKRVTISFQVIKTEIFPDYFWRWFQEYNTRISVEGILEQTSDVSPNAAQKNLTALQMLSLNFQMHPLIQNTRVNYVTLLDHVAKWGAFWGVLFGIFAIIFLSYNRSKFYKKHPEWDKFKQTHENTRSQEHILIQDQHKD